MSTELVNDRPYTMGEAAAAIGVHRNTLRRYADRRLIKRHYSRRNGRVFFLRQRAAAAANSRNITTTKKIKL